jgi:hypothetical protein
MRRLATALIVALLSVSCGIFTPAERWEEVPTNWSIDAVDGVTLTLTVEVGSSSCDRNPRIAEVVETDSVVTIRAVRETWVNANACTDDMGFTKLQVELDEPLGDRALDGCWADGRDMPCPTTDW